jgi:hypothetical protein
MKTSISASWLLKGYFDLSTQDRNVRTTQEIRRHLCEAIGLSEMEMASYPVGAGWRHVFWGTGYNQSVDRLDALDDLLPRVPSELQRRLTTAYGTIQLADSRITGDLYPNASGPDGRIIVRTVPRDSWFWPAAFLDPRTGQLEPVWLGIDPDMYGGWTPEGRVVAGALFTYSSLWRFTPNK